MPRDKLLRTLVQAQYVRNDVSSTRGTFRVKGEMVEVYPAFAESAYRVNLFGDEKSEGLRISEFELHGSRVRDNDWLGGTASSSKARSTLELLRTPTGNAPRTKGS